jgi:molybdate transport system permease protein
MPRNNVTPAPRVRSDRPFYITLALLGGLYASLIVAMIAADIAATSASEMRHTFATPEIRSALVLSLLSCSVSAIASVWVAVPLGYLLSRTRFPGREVIDTLLDIPILLPPLVVGLSLLVLFQSSTGVWFQQHVLTVTYAVPAVVLAQFAVAAAFAVRTMRVTFDQIDPRTENVARSLGCTRAQAFWRVTLPEARRGILTAFTLAWARALGEFGPILVFAGATRMRTEVLSTSVFLELSIGNLEAALAVSLLMIAVAVAVLVVTRIFGLRGTGLI